MDYVVGSVAALISGAGNTTPNRPRLLKRALTPTKHQPSPNVTPKSELVDDRSIFLSPTLQKKKAIVKKSPKRIFQNPDLDITNEGEGTASVTSPKADKVKKHLKDDLDGNKININMKSPKKVKNILNKSLDSAVNNENVENDEKLSQSLQVTNNSTPKKKKNKRNSVSLTTDNDKPEDKENIVEISNKSPQKSKQKSVSESCEVTANENVTIDKSPKKKKRKSISQVDEVTIEKSPKKKKCKSINQNDGIPTTNNENKVVSPSKNKEDTEPQGESKEIEEKPAKKKNKKRKKKSKQNVTQEDKNTNKSKLDSNTTNKAIESEKESAEPKKLKRNKTSKVNPNAITNEDSESEHESDNDINSETEDANKEILDTGPVSSDDEENNENVPKTSKKEETKDLDLDNAEVVKRTLFVGNVPFSPKCKKEIKRIFVKYGQIETVRIRGIPVKDERTTPKLAVIKSELHPERTSVNMYIKFMDPQSVDKALAENNTVLNGYHLRVTRSETSGVPHDPKLSIFVGNLPFALEDEGFRAKFEQCGEIDSVRIVRDKKTNVGKGFGYVNFKTKDGVELALAMSDEDLTIKNRILRVKRCYVTQKNHGNKFQGQNRGQRSQGMRQQAQRNEGQRGQMGQGNRGQMGRNQENRGQMGQGQGNRGHMGQGQGNRRQMGPGQGNRGQMGPGQGNRGKMGPGQGNRGQMGQNNWEGGQRMGGGQNFNPKEQGAYRRVMNKRPREERDGDGPPNKMAKDNQPREKKTRQEFVGMTAEKKKKRKFDKGQKKKKAISEILSKKSGLISNFASM